MLSGLADRLFGRDYLWSVMAAGKHQIPFITMGALNGSSVRVGLGGFPLCRNAANWPRRTPSKSA